MSIDPVVTDANTGGSFNRYAYANNSPYKYVDPDGRLPILLVPLAIKAVDIAITAVELYGAAQSGGASAVAVVAAESAAANIVPGGKIASAVAKMAGSGPVGKLIYRAASGTRDSMTPRAKDVKGLSAANSLSNALPGKNQVIDTSKLTNLCATCDNAATGHVSITPKDMSQMDGWINSRGGSETHPLTKELMDAVVDTVKN